MTIESPTSPLTRPRSGGWERPSRTPIDDDAFRDDRQSVWTLGEHLGKGTQGDVHRTREGGVALKLLARPDRSLQRVRRLPLSNLSIAGPRTYLEDGQGYTMTLADDMEPLAATLIPQDLQPVHDQAWFLGTGGLAKRLAVATRIAETLAALHARGLVYGDLQRNNVMVSRQRNGAATLLIDADNIDLEGEPTTILGTAGFIPPEVMHRTSSARLSQSQDRWALAVMVHWLLAATHPFVDRDTRALHPAQRHKRLPVAARYVDAPGRATHPAGPGTAWALSPALRAAARRSLMLGCDKPSQRLSARRWALLLRKAAFHVVECRCGWTQYGTVSHCEVCERSIRDEPRFSVWIDGDACAPLAAGHFLRRASLRLGRHSLGTAADVAVTVRHDKGRAPFEVTTRGCERVGGTSKSIDKPEVVRLRGPWEHDRVLLLEEAER